MIVSREIGINVSEGRGEIHPSSEGDIVIISSADVSEGRSEIHPSTKEDIVIVSRADASEGRGEIHPSSSTKADVTRDNSVNMSREIGINVSEGRGEIHPSSEGDIVIISSADVSEGRSEIHPSTKEDIVIVSRADASEGRGEIHPSNSTKTDVTRDNSVNVSRGSGTNSANPSVADIQRDPSTGFGPSDPLPNQLGTSSFSSSTLSLTFSSGCLTLEQGNEAEERGATVDCIDQLSYLFAGFKENPPTLEDALRSMGYYNWKGLSEKFMRKGGEKLKEFDAPGLTVSDVATIICYSFEWNKKRFGNAESPYRMLNDSLCVNRNSTAIKRTRTFMFLLLRALRKLPHSISENRVLYRGISFPVQTEADPKFPERLPYAPGNEKTWWTFTSTAMDLGVARKFIRTPYGTLTVLTGETWGYNIRMFSDFPGEKEILLEPERKLSITKVSRNDGLIIVDATILDTPLVLEDIVPATVSVEIRAKMNNIKIIPENLRVEEATERSVVLSWDPVVVGKKKVIYQVQQMRPTRFDVTVDKMIHETKEARIIICDMSLGTYLFMVRCGYDGEWGEWSKELEVDQKREEWWKECPDNVDENKRYFIDENNPKIATKSCGNGYYCTIIRKNSLYSFDVVSSWSIKILKSRNNDGDGIYIGVAPYDIDQNEDRNYYKCGWYFGCRYSSLWSGPPHNYRGIVYGPRRKENGQYFRTGDSVGVVMGTTNGKLSFVVNGMDLGVAYEGIPLDKSLVPCVILKYEGDSVEFDPSEVKETVVDRFIPVPSIITARSTTWDSITLTWDAVEGASFYQVEVDGSRFLDKSTTNVFTKGRLLPNTKHSFRVRVVRGNSVSGWSDVVKGRTQKTPDFSECVWKECPDGVHKKLKYSVDERNSRIATFIGGNSSTIIGNTPLPLNTVTSWCIKILKTKYNDGNCIYIGVAPSDINQNEDNNYRKCGWYFNCYWSQLYSGPPHNYSGKDYGPRKEKYGKYVHTGDSIGVVMDTTKGELSFILGEVNLGVAYTRIHLDKPLVPCVLLGWSDDSVKLDTFDEKETFVDNSIPAPSNVTIKMIHGTPSLSHGMLLKERRSARSKLMEARNWINPQQTHSQREAFFQRQSTLSEFVL